ncbi:hypothetical protein [Tolypothrix sp. VBCCA 56010]|uniref:hypothetical protein n=1 Tax=Tolypothrix sp. VBCCA 56010 TaxID=3137731 RepID=UPI003D7F13B7
MQLQIDNLKQQLKPPQEISLEDVAYQLGLEPDNNIGNRWVAPGVAITFNGTKFKTNSDGGTNASGDGAIDLVEHVLGCSQPYSIKWLANKFGNELAIASLNTKIHNNIVTYPMPDFKPPALVEDRWLDAKRYLTQTYGISEDLLSKEHSQNHIYADNQGNAVLLHHLMLCHREQLKRGTVVTGATIIGKNCNGLAVGSSRIEGWFGVGVEQTKLNRIALVDSPLEVLSLASLNSNPKAPTIYLSANSMDSRNINLMRQFQSRGGEIFVCCSNTPSGEKLVALVLEELKQAKRITPQLGETWNEQLQLVKQQQLEKRQQHQQVQPQARYAFRSQNVELE